MKNQKRLVLYSSFLIRKEIKYNKVRRTPVAENQIAVAAENFTHIKPVNVLANKAVMLTMPE